MLLFLIAPGKIRIPACILLSRLLLAGMLACLPLNAFPRQNGGYTAQDSIKVSGMLKTAQDNIFTDPEKSMALAKEAVRLSAALNFKHGEAYGQDISAFLYQKSGNLDSAIQLFETALKIAEDGKLQKEEARIYNHLAGAYNDRGNNEKAIDYYRRAIKLLETNIDSPVLGSVYTNLSIMMRDIKDYKNAVKYSLLALGIFKALNMPANVAGAYCNLGAMCHREKKYTEGLPYLLMAVRLGDSLHLNSILSTAYLNIGICCDELQKTDSALLYYRKSLALSRESGDKNCEILVLMGIGNIYFYKLKKNNEAEKYYLEGIELAEQLSSMLQVATYSNALAKLYEEEGRYKEAYDYRTQQSILKDSLLNNEKVVALEELTARFETRELESKNAALQKEADLKTLKLQRKDIMLYGGGAFIILLLGSGLLLMRHNKLSANTKLMQLEQKQLLAQINPHFIFNCLNSVQQFVVQNDIENANKYLVDFATLMRQTLDNSKEGTTPLYREIEYLENYLSLESMRFEDMFSYNIRCAPGVDVNTTEIPSMIIQPYVENAINHGITNLEGKAGILNVSFYKENGSLFCEVDDNGIGMEKAEEMKEHMFIKQQSRGMEMTRQRLALVSRMEGADYSVSVINKKDKNGLATGTTIIIKFPLKA